MSRPAAAAPVRPEPDLAQTTMAPARASGREIELKLRLREADLAALRLRLDALAAAHVERVDSTYFDTRDLRLARARAALRLRCLGQGRSRRWVQTFKAGDSNAALSHRGEWETPAPEARIETARLRDSPLARILAGGAPRAPARPRLRAVFRTLFERSTWLLDWDGARIEAALDIGEIRAGRCVEAICELELELKAGAAQALPALALVLAGAVPGCVSADLSLLPYGESKAARGYRLARCAAGGNAPPPAPRLPLSADLTRAAALRAVCATQMQILQDQVAGYLVDADAERIHQGRVALRRLRAASRLSGARAMPAPLAHSLSLWLDRLGPVRDADVFCNELLPAMAPALPAGAALRLERAARTLQGRRADLLRAQLQGPQFAQFLLELLHFVAAADSGGKSFVARWKRALEAGAARLRQGQQHYEELTPRRRHKLRILAKVLRYGWELLPPQEVGRGRRRAARALARFQDAAGIACDARLARELLPQLTGARALRAAVRDWARARERASARKVRRLPDLP